MGTDEKANTTTKAEPKAEPAPAAIDPYSTNLDAQREANEKAYQDSIKGQELPPSVRDEA